MMDLNRIYLVGTGQEAEEVDLLGRYQECFAAFMAGLRKGTPFETDRTILRSCV